MYRLLIIFMLIATPALAGQKLVYKDVPDALVDEINDKVYTTLARWEREQTDITDTVKKERLEAKIEAIRREIKPAPVVVNFEPKVEEPVAADPIAVDSVNWSDVEAITR